MGVMDKFLDLVKLNGVDDGYDDDYNEDYDLDEQESVFKPKPMKASAMDAPDDGLDEPEEKPLPKKLPKVAPMRQKSSKKNGGDDMKVCVIKPTSVEDAREITETLLADRTVVLNLEKLDVGIAQRIIDFTSGSCFAISGNMQKISEAIFLITPASVDISGDFAEVLSGSFDMPFGNV
ncbi:MAG: cell division protein SepF [Lachnospiraceae bacterium]|nr:cell division protein SepF [Lachnospiraceae bacterium]